MVSLRSSRQCSPYRAPKIALTLFRGLQKRPKGAKAGVRDQQIGAESLGRAGNLLNARPGGKVRNDALHAPAVRGDCLAHRFQSIRVAPSEQQGRLSGEGARKGCADAAAGARDERCLVCPGHVLDVRPHARVASISLRDLDNRGR